MTDLTRTDNEIRFLARTSTNGEELCGLLVKSTEGLVVVQIPNRASEPKTAYRLDDKEYLHWYARGEIWGVWHTHPVGSAGWSQADLAVAEAVAFPQVLYECEPDKFSYWTPNGFRAPLVERYYCSEIHDCYACVRDAVERITNDSFPDLDRRTLNNRGGLPEAHQLWEPMGFAIAYRPRTGRVAVLSIQAEGLPNHLGFMVRDDQMLHHAFESQSEVVTHIGFWRAVTLFYLRHEKIEAALGECEEIDAWKL